MSFKAARIAAGLTQAQAGAVIGASKRAVQEWESVPPRRNIPAAKLTLFLMLVGGAVTQPAKEAAPGPVYQSTT